MHPFDADCLPILATVVGTAFNYSYLLVEGQLFLFSQEKIEIMDVTEAESIILGIKYKPGTEIAIEKRFRSYIVVRIDLERKNVNKPGKLFLLTMKSTLYVREWMGVGDILQQMREHLLRLEAHELDEYLTFDGVQWFSPHSDEETILHDNTVTSMNSYWDRDKPLGRDRSCVHMFIPPIRPIPGIMLGEFHPGNLYGDDK